MGSWGWDYLWDYLVPPLTTGNPGNGDDGDGDGDGDGDDGAGPT